MNFGTLFSGGEGVGVGLTAAGLSHAWGIEYDAQIAAVAQANGFDVRVADVRAVDYAGLPRVGWLHASPPCTRASVANANATESEDDISMAAAVERALQAQQPDVFTLENVWQYRTFAAFRLICDALGALGYIWDYSHENAANYGVPQARKRLILRASRGLLPILPAPVPWVGWYAAIEDLIPTLPESKLAPWQLARLPEELRTWLVGNQQMERCEIYTGADLPAFSVTTQHGGRARAVLVDRHGNTSRDMTVLPDDATAMTVQAWHGRRPAQTPRAVLIKGDDNSGDFGVVTCAADEPAFGLRASRSADHRAVLPARVVSMTPRCLARFQSVPDSYVLPDKRTLAARVIGNMVPPLLMQRIAEGMTA